MTASNDQGTPNYFFGGRQNSTWTTGDRRCKKLSRTGSNSLSSPLFERICPRHLRNYLPSTENFPIAAICEGIETQFCNDEDTVLLQRKVELSFILSLLGWSFFLGCKGCWFVRECLWQTVRTLGHTILYSALHMKLELHDAEISRFFVCRSQTCDNTSLCSSFTFPNQTVFLRHAFMLSLPQSYLHHAEWSINGS